MNKRLLFCLILVFLGGCSSPEEKIEQYLKSAHTLFAQGKYKHADVEFRNALQIDANVVEALYGIAQIAEKQANWKKAYKVYARVVELDPLHDAAQLMFGKLNLAGGQLDKALEISAGLLAKGQNNADFHAFRAAVLYKLTDSEGAVAAANAALEIEPKNADALLVLAMERLAENDAAQAIKYLNRGLLDNDKNIVLQIVKVQALSQVNDLGQAVEVYRRLIDYYPSNMAFSYRLAQLYTENEKWREAEAVFKGLVDKNPKDINIKLRLVRYLLTYQNAERAIQQLSKYIAKAPQEYKFRFALAELFAQIKDLNKAKKTYQDIVVKDGNGVNGLLAKSRLALVALAEADMTLAKALIEEILVVEARNPEALIIRANMSLKRRVTEAAISDLRVVLRDEPGSVKALRLLAQAYLQQGAVEQAKDQYIKAIRTNPAELNVALEYAQLLFREQALLQAGEVLQNILRQAPSHLNALQIMAQVKLGQQKWGEAQALAERISAIEGGEAISNQVMGVAFQGRQQYDKSIDAFKRAHKSSPAAVQPLVALVQAYVQMGKNKEAERFLNAVLRVDTDNIFAHVLLGRLYFMEGELDKAEHAFRTAIAANPTSTLAYTSLAALLMQSNKLSDAQLILEQGLQKVPGDFLLRITLAGAFEKAKEIERAIVIYELILEENPNVDLAANNLASLLSDYRDDTASRDRALALVERFRRSEVPYFQDTLGWVYHQAGKQDEAAPFLKKAVEALPTLPVFRYHLGMNYLKSDQKVRAKEELERAVSLPDVEFPGVIKARDELERL